MDFSKWIYTNYIRNYVKSCPTNEYWADLSFMDGELLPCQREAYDRVLEFWATRAFSLGLRTGAGLKAELE